MKRNIILIGFISLLIFVYSCKDKKVESNFEDLLGQSIFDVINDSPDQYSSFLAIVKAAGVDKLLTAYNPDVESGYTLFLPTNKAIEAFLKKNPQLGTLQNLCENKEYVNQFCRYHILNMGASTDNFPYGAFSKRTLSGHLLTVTFTVENDSSFYKINGQAPVEKVNIECSNGYVHIISTALSPVTRTTYGWLTDNSTKGYSIFKEAIDATGLINTLSVNIYENNEDGAIRPYTVLMEHDSIFAKRNISSFAELAHKLSPNSTDYASKDNPVYNFMAYHILNESYFLDKFVNTATNYSTVADVPVYIDGKDLNIMINKGKSMIDSIIVGEDTTFVDYIGFDYEKSNILTQSGAIHFIDQIMYIERPAAVEKTLEFWEEPYLTTLSEEAGSYLIENHSSLNNFKWSGTDLSFIETGDDQSSAWNGNYLYMYGDFVISYQTEKVVPGKYNLILGADSYNDENALVQVKVDGKPIGGLIDLTKHQNASTGSPFPWSGVTIGSVNFLKYDRHTIEISSIIPGRFCWDFVRFAIPKS